MWLDCSDHLSLLLQVCTVTVGMVRWRRGKKKKVFSLSLEIPPLVGCKLSVSLRARNPWNTQVILVVEHSITRHTRFLWLCADPIQCEEINSTESHPGTSEQGCNGGEYFCAYFNRQSLCKLSNNTPVVAVFKHIYMNAHGWGGGIGVS